MEGSLFGIDGRIAYASKKYHSSWMAVDSSENLVGLPNNKASRSRTLIYQSQRREKIKSHTPTSFHCRKIHLGERKITTRLLISSSQFVCPLEAAPELEELLRKHISFDV